MAKKSKTQRAKASAARAEKKEQAQQKEAAEDKAADSVGSEPADTKKPKLGFLKKSEEGSAPAEKKQPEKKQAEKKEEKKVKKPGFLSQVRAELKRVTWPSRQDVLRWSGVVLAALVFFGVFVAVLDNFVVTPILIGISGIGA